MQLDIRGSNLRLSRRMRAYVEHRAYFALSRFGERVVEVHVWLSDENGPRRGVDRVCKVLTTVRGAAPFLVEQRDTRLNLAVDHALDRAARRVARTMERIDRSWVTSADP
jgi:ribosomal subunit interface protein